MTKEFDNIEKMAYHNGVKFETTGGEIRELEQQGPCSGGGSIGGSPGSQAEAAAELAGGGREGVE
jgi:hypothetical protein